MRVITDVEKCIGSGGCVFACPEVFDQDEDGIVRVLDANPGEELRDRVQEAMDACPAGVISVE